MYEFGYLSVATNPQSGELFATLLPDVTVESFQSFLDGFVSFPGQMALVRLITDGASAHRNTRLNLTKDSELNIIRRIRQK